MASVVDELKARIEKLEKMVVWAYSFSSDELGRYDDLFNGTWECGEGSPDPVAWGVGVVECQFDCEIPPLDKPWSPW